MESLLRSTEALNLETDGTGAEAAGRDRCNGEAAGTASGHTVRHAGRGLGRADHARFVLDLVERHSEGGVLIDETIHGHRLDAGFLSELFRFPLILLLGHGVLLAAFAVWAGASRFGAPRSAPPALGLGRQVLIGNVAELIAVVGRTPNLLPRYDRQTVRAVARHFGFTPARGTAAGGAADEDAALGRIREIERLRGVDPTLDRIRAEAGPDGGSRRAAIERALKVSMRLHRWRTEMTHVD